MHGLPDFGIYAPKSTTYALDDMAELAARLGSIVTLDRRGDTILLDDFDDAPLRWAIATNVEGSTAARDTTNPRRGAAGVLLHTAANALATAQIYRSFELPRASKIGAEISHTLPADISYIQLGAYLYTGTLLYLASMMLNVAADQLSIGLPGSGSQVLLNGLQAYSDDKMWYSAKLVWDWQSKMYRRCIWGGVEYDISAYAPNVIANTTAPHIAVIVIAAGAVSGTGDVYLDDFIYTQNEP